MRLKLKAAGESRSPETALEELRKLMHVRLNLPAREKPVHVLANQSPTHSSLFKALDAEPLTRTHLPSLAVQYEKSPCVPASC